MYRCLLVFVLVGLVPLGAQSATQSYSCGAPPQIQDSITQAGPGGIESLLAKYPNDFWVRRAFIDATAGGGSVVEAAPQHRNPYRSGSGVCYCAISEGLC